MLRTWLLALSVLALLPTASFAQRLRPIDIEDAHIGLPPGQYTSEKDPTTYRAQHVIKANTWAPMYLKLKLNKEVQGGIAAVVTAVDADGQRTSYTLPIMNNISDRLPGSKIEPAEINIMPYIRTADDRYNNATVSVQIISTGKSTFGNTLSDEYRFTNIGLRDTATFALLSLGSRLPGFELPKSGGDPNQNQVGSNRGALRAGRVETAAITDVGLMPDQWIGYSAADLVLLTTGAAQNDFLDQLFDTEKSRPYAGRRAALLEYVRRGGSLVISAGGNTLKLANSPIFRDLLPTEITPDKPVESVPEVLLSWKVAGTNVPVTPLRGRAATFNLTTTSVTAKKPARVLMEARENEKLKDLPIIAQTTLGLGRITFVAFDLEQSPFTEFSKRAEFWDFLIRNSSSERAALPPPSKNNSNQLGFNSTNFETEEDFLVGLRNYVDYFEGVPVISFGWVALFILLYTLLIGPVEYLFLKFVLRRLELTWITFPLIVLTISAAAYFTAYALKGSDLRTNKVDLVDVDLTSNRVYGRTWLTIFSPRVDKYNVTVEPREEWGLTAKDDSAPLIDWMGGTQGGTNRGSFLGRSYEYALGKEGEIGAGLTGVRIPVWSTKALTGQWVATVPKDSPLIESALVHPPGNPELVSGSFTYNLPTPTVTGAVLFYRGFAYKLPALSKGQKVTVPSIGRDRGLRSGLDNDPDWFSRQAALPVVQNNNNYTPWGRPQQTSATASNVSLFGLMFHQRALGGDGRDLQNASLRNLDQSWRLAPDYKDEVILVGKVEKTVGPAEQLMNGSEVASPVKLWLKDLPGDDGTGKAKKRPEVPGSLQQETYFRVYIPIAPVKAKDKN